MDICGLWKVREMHLVTPDGEKVFTADSQVDNDMYAEIVQMCKYIMEFAPDGTLNTLLFVPEEVREEAKKQGADIRENGYAVWRVPYGRKKTESSTMTPGFKARCWAKRLIPLQRFHFCRMTAFSITSAR